MKHFFSLLAVLLLFSTFIFGQPRKITGQVVNDRGQPVSFATVTETNTSNATVADVNGNFTLSVTGNQITITAAGFQGQTVTVTGSTVTVTLVSGGQMQEVVVTALGIRKTRNQ